MPLRVLIVRHGETVGNTKKLIQGQLDGPETWLNTIGLEQAAKCRDGLRNVPITTAFSSDLTRAADTARIILENHQEVELQLSEALREIFMGEIQGLVYHPDLYNPVPASVETTVALNARFAKFWDEEIVSRARSGAEGTILLVSHGGAVSALFTVLRDLQYTGQGGWGNAAGEQRGQLPVMNASITTVEVHADGSGEVVRFADVTHLMNA